MRLGRYIVDRIGVEFPYHGDAVIWIWPWRRRGRGPFLSVSLTGNGDFGDATFKTLRQLRDTHDSVGEAMTACRETRSTP